MSLLLTYLHTKNSQHQTCLLDFWRENLNVTNETFFETFSNTVHSVHQCEKERKGRNAISSISSASISQGSLRSNKERGFRRRLF